MTGRIYQYLNHEKENAATALLPHFVLVWQAGLLLRVCTVKKNTEEGWRKDGYNFKDRSKAESKAPPGRWILL